MFKKDGGEGETMDTKLIFATGAITLALVFYTIGVFGERRSGELSLRNLLFFWAGLACDTTGTLIMTSIAQSAGAAGFGIHAASGTLAIALMLVHAGWATWTYLRGNERQRAAFHRFSTVVWLVWLVPYVIGLLVGIPAIHLMNVCAVGTSVIIVGALAFLLLRSDAKKARRG